MALFQRIGFILVLFLRKKKTVVDLFTVLFLPLRCAGQLLVAL
jgi:hypothetical protein